MSIARNSFYATVVIKVTLQAKHLPFLITPMYILNTQIKNKEIFQNRTETAKKIWGKELHKTHDQEVPKTIYYFFLS